jgi:hypothetical protein
MTGILAARADGVSCGASMVKTNVDFPSEAVRCQVRTLLQPTHSLAEMQCSGTQMRKIAIVSTTGPDTNSISLLSGLKYAK